MSLPTTGLQTTYDEFQYRALTGNTIADNSPTSFGTGAISAGRLQKQVVYILSAAQLKALQTTAVQLVAAPNTIVGVPPVAPGIGYALVPESMVLEYIFNTTAYTIANADNAFQIEYTGKTTNIVKSNATGLVDQTASQVIRVAPAVAGTVIATANEVNLGLEVKLVGTTPALTLGDGLLALTLHYDVVILY